MPARHTTELSDLGHQRHWNPALRQQNATGQLRFVIGEPNWPT